MTKGPFHDGAWTVADRVARAASWGEATPLNAEDMTKILDLIEACRAAVKRKPRVGSPLSVVAHCLERIDADVRGDAQDPPDDTFAKAAKWVDEQFAHHMKEARKKRAKGEP